MIYKAVKKTSMPCHGALTLFGRLSAGGLVSAENDKKAFFQRQKMGVGGGERIYGAHYLNA
ncbi:hypothetical protein [Pseudomonas sp. NFACC02]|uniref:hypothetical protein n=1 Tax=Pseudomonas sp. NFACC02 TaxID=1566250 RepID=UPI001113B78D|nr:hypothetical protein [Pseudomonas sp. NFACC02]